MNTFGTPRLVAFCCGLILTSAAVSAQEHGPDAGRCRLAERMVFRGQEPEPENREFEFQSPFEEHLETDRDSFTPSTRTVNPGRWIVESAYSFIDNRRAPDTHSFPELVVRYGLTERIELRLGWNYEVGGGGNVVSSVEGEEGLEGTALERESRALYGIKFRATEQDAWLPESSFIAQVFTPTSGIATATEISSTFVLGWELPNRWKLDAGLRYATDGEADDDFATWSPSVVMRIPFAEQWHSHVEYFAAYPQGLAGAHPQHFISPGVHYLVTPDLEIGTRFGWGLNDASAKFFINAGVGWRF